jgi:hypothetical protein
VGSFIIERNRTKEVVARRALYERNTQQYLSRNPASEIGRRIENPGDRGNLK